MHRSAAYDSARAGQQGCAHALEQPTAECQPREHRLSAAEDALVAIATFPPVHRLAPAFLLPAPLTTIHAHHKFTTSGLIMEHLKIQGWELFMPWSVFAYCNFTPFEQY